MNTARVVSGRRNLWLPRVYDRNVPKADVPSAEELREIGRRLCVRIGVRPHEPIDSVALRRDLVL